MEWAVLASIIYIIIFVIEKCREVKRLKNEIARIERSRDRWEDYYRGRIDKLQKIVDEDTKHRIHAVSEIPQGTIEAVKYAMKKSHPDNGGNAEDFMRFQKVYEELTGNGG